MKQVMMSSSAWRGWLAGNVAHGVKGKRSILNVLPVTNVSRPYLSGYS
jgi:hypothetical protein